ncbi:MAG: tetratricopeptide repeat protein, partial [Roseibacillus sp.]|nr:tetratricopeptide repeat protein [Roseibacillus sp.]
MLVVVLATPCPLNAQAEEPPGVEELLAQGRFEEALPTITRREQEWSLEVRDNDSKEARLNWALSLHARGSVEERLQRFDEALDHLRHARDLAIGEQFDPAILAGILDALGRAEGKAGSYEEAGQSLLQAIEEHRKLDPADREPWLSASQNHLGLVYLTTGRYEEAGRIFHETLGQAGENEEALCFQHECLGRYFYVMRSYAKAAEHLEEAREYALGIEGRRKEHPEVVSLTGQIGLALLRLGPESRDLARRYLLEAANLTRELRNSRVNSLALASHLSNLGSLELEAEGNEKARGLFREALSISRELLGDDA